MRASFEAREFDGFGFPEGGHELVERHGIVVETRRPVEAEVGGDRDAAAGRRGEGDDAGRGAAPGGNRVIRTALQDAVQVDARRDGGVKGKDRLDEAAEGADHLECGFHAVARAEPLPGDGAVVGVGVEEGIEAALAGVEKAGEGLEFDVGGVAAQQVIRQFPLVSWR